MSREVIKEGLLSKVKSIRQWRFRPDIDPLSAEDDTDDILKWLHSQGAVLKIDRGLPNQCPTQLEMDIHQALIKYLNDKIDLFNTTNAITGIYKQAGCGFFEPLVEE